MVTHPRPPLIGWVLKELCVFKNVRQHLSDTVSQEVMSVYGVPSRPVPVHYGRKRICENCL